MSVILVPAGFLAPSVEGWTQGVAAGQQSFTQLVIVGHSFQGVLQLQPRFTQLLMFDFALFAQLQQLAVQAGATEYQLLDLGLPGGQLGPQRAGPTGQG